MKATDSRTLRADIFEEVADAKAGEQSASEATNRILDAVDRALASPSPETGGGATVGPAKRGNEYVPCPKCGSIMFCHCDAPVVPAAEPPPAPAELLRDPLIPCGVCGLLGCHRPHAGVPCDCQECSRPAAEPGKPATCEVNFAEGSVCSFCEKRAICVSSEHASICADCCAFARDLHAEARP